MTRQRTIAACHADAMASIPLITTKEKPMFRKLTADEIRVCNEFEAILIELMPSGMQAISVTRHRDFSSAACSSSYRAHFGAYSGAMADRLQSALNEFAAHNPTPEQARAARVAELRAELAKLESAA